jgi:hypothetical protein
VARSSRQRAAHCQALTEGGVPTVPTFLQFGCIIEPGDGPIFRPVMQRVSAVVPHTQNKMRAATWSWRSPDVPVIWPKLPELTLVLGFPQCGVFVRL